MGLWQRDPRKEGGGKPIDRREDQLSGQSQSAPKPTARAWTIQDWLTACLAMLIALCLVGAAVWQATPRGPSTPRTGQVARAPALRPVADSLPADEPAAASPVNVGKKKVPDARAPRDEASPDASPSSGEAHDVASSPAADLTKAKNATAHLSEIDEAPRAKGPASAEDKIAASPDPATAPKEAAGAVQVQAPTEKDAHNEALALDEPDDYDESGAEDFACPVPWLRDSRMTERVKYLNNLQRLLKAGWEEKPDAAREHFEAAKKLCSNDPRLGYAFGLVLWKNGEHSEARKQWEAATQTGIQPYLPALSVLAWASLMDHDTAAGFAAIERVADALAQTHGDYPTAAQRLHATLFLGRAIGFLIGPGESPELIDQVRQTEQRLLGSLPDDLRQTFMHGQSQAAQRFEEFQRLLERPPAEVAAELRREQQRVADELKALRQELKQLDNRRREIPREAKKKLAALADEVPGLEEKISRHSTGIQEGQAVVQGLSQPRRIFAGYITVSERVPFLVKENGRNVTTYQIVTRQIPQYRNETPQEVQARTKDRDEVLSKLKTGTEELKQFEDRLNEIPGERAELTKMLRQERREKARAAALARRKIAELSARERDLQKDFSTPDELRERMTSLAPYVPWTPDSDREGLVASYHQKAAPPQPAMPRDRQKASK